MTIIDPTDPVGWLAVAARAAMKGDICAAGLALKAIQVERMVDDDIGAISVALGALAAASRATLDKTGRAGYEDACMLVTETANAPSSARAH